MNDGYAPDQRNPRLEHRRELAREGQHVLELDLFILKLAFFAEIFLEAFLGKVLDADNEEFLLENLIDKRVTAWGFDGFFDRFSGFIFNRIGKFWHGESFGWSMFR